MARKRTRTKASGSCKRCGTDVGIDQRLCDACTEITHELVTANKALVYDVYNSICGMTCIKQMGFDDAIGSGTVALVRAAEGFDASHGLKFSTYAYHSVRREMLRAAAYYAHLSVPKYFPGIKVEHLEAYNSAFGGVSFNRFDHEHDRLDTSTPAEDPVLAGELDELKKALAKLPKPLRLVIVCRMLKGMSRTEVAKKMGQSKETITALTRKAVDRLREIMGQACKRCGRPTSNAGVVCGKCLNAGREPRS